MAQNPPYDSPLDLRCHGFRNVGIPPRRHGAIFVLTRFTKSLCVSVPIYGDLNEELGISYDMLNNGYATNMATLAIGCIIFIPIALLIGRRPVYIFTAIVMFISAIWQAKMQTVGDMIGTNAISGVAGAVNEALFQVTVGSQ